MPSLATRVPSAAEPSPSPDAAGSPLPPLWWPGLIALAAAKLALHIVTLRVTPYSVHRDELLYLAMGRYLDFWRMDFPPLIAVLARAQSVFGDSLFAIRATPALAGTLLVVMAAVIAREFGGGRLAQTLAALGVLTGPLFLRAAALFQPVVFDQLWWTLALFAVARIGGRGTRAAPADWPLLGAAGGLGLLTKFSIGFIAVGIALGFLLTRERRWLLTPWPYSAALLSLGIGAASIVGQLRLGFPVAGQMRDLQQGQLAHVSPLAFLTDQALLLGPGVLLAVAGAAALLASATVRRWRALGVACLATFLLLLVLGGKAYYIGPIYPALFAAGAVALERMGRFRGPVALATGAVMSSFALVSLPVVLPIASPEATARHAARLGATAAVRTNQGEVLPLPQDFADMLGWEEQVAAVARVYGALPPEDRHRAVILASNYGEAGAIDHFGPRWGLPRAVSPAGSYWFFGPGELPGDVAVGLGLEIEDVRDYYRESEVVLRVPNPWGVPEQQDNPVTVLRAPVRSLQEIWPELAGQN